jgi:putative acetyltransferase
VDAAVIREAGPRDYPAIRAILRHAFATADEANLVDELRADGAVLAEFVAASDIALQGHALYSRLAIEQNGETLAGAALAPVAVLGAFQRKGLGAALIKAGNARCAGLGLAAILVVGDGAYYRRFGFSSEAATALAAPFSGAHFMALPLQPGVLQAGGRVRYAKAFGV